MNTLLSAGPSEGWQAANAVAGVLDAALWIAAGIGFIIIIYKFATRNRKDQD